MIFISYSFYLSTLSLSVIYINNITAFNFIIWLRIVYTFCKYATLLYIKIAISAILDEIEESKKNNTKLHLQNQIESLDC